MSRTQIINLVLLVLWLGVIFFLSSEPSTSSSMRSGAVVDVVRSINPDFVNKYDAVFAVRKAAHITAYFILGILMYRVVRMFKLPSRKAVTLSAMFIALYAISDEVHQLFVNGRSGEVRDVIIDTVAGTIGVLVIFLIIQVHTSRRVRNASENVKNNV